MTSSLKTILIEPTSTDIPLIELQPLEPLHCHKDSLTDVVGWIAQIVLAAIAFSCLIGN